MNRPIRENLLKISVRTLLVFFVLSFSIVLSAQNRTIWGYLRDSATQEPIALASVKNLSTGQTVMTSSTGRFKINLAKNQYLGFAAVDYHFDTIQYNGWRQLQDTLQLLLRPLAHTLGNVTVTARGMSRYQLDSMERRNEFLKDVGHVQPVLAQPQYGVGIAISLDRFSKKEKGKRKAFDFYDENEKEEYINYRFPAKLVTEYTGLKDEKLQDFMQRYRPTYEWLRAHPSEEDIKYYLNDKLKVYFKR
jgi:hypothetical protein